MTQDGIVGEIDTSRPHPARIYDYLLGGKDHYEVDEEAGERLVSVAPEARVSVRANRDFLRRAVRYVVGEGVRQILDIGTGLPTSPNVHEIAHEAATDVRVAYVDNDPIVKRHADALLSRTGETSIVLADLRDPRSVVDHPEVRRIIDFDEPVALLLVAILHFVTDAEKPAEIVSTLRDALPDGSFLVLSHATGDLFERSDAQAVYNNATASMNLRGHAEVERFFDGFDLVDPGLTQVPFWRPDGPLPENAASIGFYGGVGRK
ncbi:SAM-dependent methyltransferase [Streptomyces justiciae]|uniref:SAM-dependent methyltransferase n=1 Tax=Streptomyces justiciae TaxID=2780140 RepID=UPI0018819C86|nr:SAM-dependent methyltransferase [Streptomyces justiciae]MBE8470718.1 SAM-dependent methyltransferase [Streptomyces justiciae]MCW8378611.1 SAM-dependent methyltransferase [Streptomyces justiciae]